MNAFQRFLLANRPLCELCSGPYPSTRIIKHKGRDCAVCDAHWRANHPLQVGYERRLEQHKIEGTYSNFNRYIAGDR